MDYESGVKPHKQMAIGGGGDYGVEKLRSHMGREHPELGGPTNAAALADANRGHSGHNRRTTKSSLDSDVDHGPVDFWTPDQKRR